MIVEQDEEVQFMLLSQSDYDLQLFKSRRYRHSGTVSHNELSLHMLLTQGRSCHYLYTHVSVHAWIAKCLCFEHFSVIVTYASICLCIQLSIEMVLITSQVNFADSRRNFQLNSLVISNTFIRGNNRHAQTCITARNPRFRYLPQNVLKNI